MSFQLSRDEEPERPDFLAWDGTAARAREFVDWARDEALLLFAQAIPPRYGAAPDEPDGRWRLKVRVPVPPDLGGGDMWSDVEQGETVRNVGTWVDPLFKIEPKPEKKAAAAFDHPV